MFPRLSAKENVVLNLLRYGEELYGLEMVKRADGGLKRGTIYVTLNRMVEKGYVDSRQEKNPADPGLPRRLYHITGEGRRILHANEAATAAWADGTTNGGFNA